MPNRKPISRMTKAELVAHLEKEFAAEEYFTGVLGNRHHFTLAKPSRRERASGGRTARQRTKTSG